MIDDLDEIIDDVAKAMTAAPPDPGLAGRVSTRIAEAGERRAIWPRPWVLVPMAAACVSLLAVFVARQGSVRLKPDATTNTAPDIAKVEQRGPYVERAFQARGSGDPERVALRNPLVQIARLPDLAPPAIAPIEVDRLGVQPIAEMSAIEFSSIAIDRIDISVMP